MILKLRPDVFAMRLERRARLRDAIEDADARHREGGRELQPRRILRAGARTSSSAARRATRSISSAKPTRLRDRYGTKHLRPKPAARAPPRRSRHARRRSHLAEGRELRQPLVGHHVGLTERMKDQSGADARPGLERASSKISISAACSIETLVVAIGEFGRSPEKGVSTSRQRQQRRRPRSLAVLLHRVIAGAGIKRGYVHGKSDKTASSPAKDPVHPTELLATIYHAFGIDPGDDRLQSPQPAARAGEGEGGHEAVRVICRSGFMPRWRFVSQESRRKAARQSARGRIGAALLFSMSECLFPLGAWAAVAFVRLSSWLSNSTVACDHAV